MAVGGKVLFQMWTNLLAKSGEIRTNQAEISQSVYRHVVCEQTRSEIEHHCDSMAKGPFSS